MSSLDEMCLESQKTIGLFWAWLDGFFLARLFLYLLFALIFLTIETVKLAGLLTKETLQKTLRIKTK